MKKLTTNLAIISICAAICLFCLGAAKVNEITVGGEYNLSSMKAPVVILTTEPVTLRGKLNGTIECRAEGVNLTLKDVKATSKKMCALVFSGSGNTLTLEGINTLTSGSGCPGILVEDDTELTITGEGKLTAKGGETGAGIGGGDCHKGGTITIESGDITAIGGDSGAGIGGGSCRGGGKTTINGGTVTAKGGKGGAGIGGAGDNNGGTILITGGTVTATCEKGGGAGIGDGWNSSSRVIYGGEITITGGTVTATSPMGGAGIGGGGFSSGGIITIEGGTIVASGTSAGIGGGSTGIDTVKLHDDHGLITISGGTITATGGAGIGGSDVLITGGTITATGSIAKAGIDVGLEGQNRTVKSITITGGTIVARGGGGAAGIGNGPWRRMDTIRISGGDITAIGGEPCKTDFGAVFGGGAGIGAGCNTSVSKVIITGGTIRAYGGTGGAGIGTGGDAYLDTILIAGGTVIAIGGKYGAGIGGGKHVDNYETTITKDSLVYARRGEGITYDIGPGDGGSIKRDRTFISEKAAVFLGTMSFAAPVAKAHTLKWTESKTDPLVVRSDNGTPAIFGIEGTGVSPWADAAVGYFVLCTVRYDSNGGTGELPETVGPVHITATVTAAGGDGLVRDGYTFIGWNTRADRKGKRYFPGDEILFSSSETELTLFAQWNP